MLRWAFDYFVCRWSRNATHHLLLTSQGVVELYANKAADHSHSSFADWCSAHTGSKCVLHVSGELQHQVSPPGDHAWPGVADAEAYGLQLLSHYHGDIARNWPLAVWRSRIHWGLSALHGVVLHDLLEIAKVHAVRIQGLRPLWAGALARQEGGLGRQLIMEGALLTCIQVRHGQCTNVQQRRLAEPTIGELRSWLKANSDAASTDIVCGHSSECTVDDAPLPVAKAVLTGLNGIGDWWDSRPTAALSFQPEWNVKPNRVSGLVWVVTGLTLIGTVLTVGETWTAWQDWQDSSLELSKWTAADEHLANSTAPRSVSVIPTSIDTKAVDAANDMATRLLHPWGDILVSVEQASRANVHWVSLDYKVDSSELRVEGISVDLPSALQAAKALADKSGWQAVLLTRASLGNETSGVRFEVSARRVPVIAGSSVVDPKP